MRTVTFSQSGGRIPYIYIYINSVDYSSRLLYLEHHEEPYREQATIGLSNRDRHFDTADPVTGGLLNLDGYEFNIGYGFGGEKVDTPTLWVKSHQNVSLEGERIYQIYAEGMWMRMQEQKVISGVTGVQSATPEPYGNTFEGTYTVEELMKLIVEAMGWTWTAVTNSDGIIDVFKPTFAVNRLPYEDARFLLNRLVWMTKCYLRPKSSKTFEVVYPQTTDLKQEEYFSDKAHYFYEYVEKTNLLIPNSIVVLCNQDPSGEWNTDDYQLIVGTASDVPTNYDEIVGVYQAGTIGHNVSAAQGQIDADNRASAILTRIKAEILAGHLIVPHDARVELYDKVRVEDSRGINV